MAKDKHKDFLREVVQSSMGAYLTGMGVKLANASDTHKGSAFLDFYVREVAVPLHHLDIEAAESGMECDGPKDMGMDFICRQDDTYHIIQSKYKQGGNVKTEEIAGFFDIQKTLRDGRYKKDANDYVRDALREYKPSTAVRYWFVTTARVSDEVGRLFANKKATAEKQAEDCEWNLVDLPQLREQYHEVLSGDTPGEIHLPIPQIAQSFGGKKGRPYIDLSDTLGEDNKYRTIATAIKGTVLHGLFAKHKNNLFNQNIRGFLGGHKTINKKIRKTLEDQPEHFYLFNNGISATCTDMDVRNGDGGVTLVCKNFQIINGAQTTATIGKFNPQKLGKVWVLLRLTKTEDIKKQSKGLNRTIMESNNSQTVIRLSDFRSNDPIQNFLADKFPKEKYKGSAPFMQWRYMPKRGERPSGRNTAIITLEELAKCLYAYRSLHGFKDGNPAVLYSQSNFLYDERDGDYWKIFGNDGDEVEAYDADRVREIIAIASLRRYIAGILGERRKKLKKENDTDSPEYMAACLTWHYLWSFSVMLSALGEEKQERAYRRIIDGKAFETGFVEEMMNQVSERIETALHEAPQQNGGTSQILNFKRWQRDGSKINGLEPGLRRRAKVLLEHKIFQGA